MSKRHRNPLARWFSKKQPRIHKARVGRLTVEALEDRLLLATLVWSPKPATLRWSDAENWLVMGKKAVQVTRDDTLQFTNASALASIPDLKGMNHAGIIIDSDYKGVIQLSTDLMVKDLLFQGGSMTNGEAVKGGKGKGNLTVTGSSLGQVGPSLAQAT